MAEAIELKAWTRGSSGKGGARPQRREGRIPGILYGDKQEPETISVDYRTIYQQIHTGHFQSTIYVLDIEGKKTRVIPRAGPGRSHPRLSHPCRFPAARQGCARDRRSPGALPQRSGVPGLKRGGVLNIVRHEIAVRCPADAIPDHFEVDLTGLEIGDSVHISALKLPEGVRPTITKRDFTVATIVGGAAEEPAPGAAAAAPRPSPAPRVSRLPPPRRAKPRTRKRTRRSRRSARRRRRRASALFSTRRIAGKPLAFAR